MLSFKRILCAVLLLLCLSLCLFSLYSCAEETQQGESGEKQDFMAMELDAIKKYIEIGKYKSIEILSGEKNRDEAVWDAVESNFKIKEFPTSQVEYYRSQLEAEYRYRAEKDGMSDSEIDTMLENARENIIAEARALTKSDLVYAVIVKLEGISITEDEKLRLFDKYVDKYVSVYGYSAEYVSENMADEIYSSMLFDKTTEFLLTNNVIKEK